MAKAIYKTAVLVLAVLIFPALVDAQITISNSGVGTLRHGDLTVALTENGINGILGSGEELAGPAIYRILDSKYKPLLDSSGGIIRKNKLIKDDAGIVAQQVLQAVGVTVEFSQQVCSTPDGVEIVYTVKPLEFDPSLKFKQQRITVNLNGKNFANRYSVVSSSGKTVSAETFSGTQINPGIYTLYDKEGHPWSVKITIVDGRSSVEVQLYSSYNKFINMSVSGSSGYKLKMEIKKQNGPALVVSSEAAVSVAEESIPPDDLAKYPKDGINLLTNGSFDFGMTDWKTEWMTGAENPVWKIVNRDERLHCAYYTGKNLRGVKLISVPFPIDGNKVFSVSADLKGTRKNQVVMLGVTAAPVDGQQRSKFFLWKKFELSDNWAKYNATFVLPASWAKKNICFMVGPEVSGVPFMVANAALFPGLMPGKESPMRFFGMKVQTGKLGNIFMLNEPAEIQTEQISLAAQKSKFTLKTEIVDLSGKKVASTENMFLIGEGQVNRLSFPVKTSARGYFFFKYTLTDDSGQQKVGMVPFCVISDNSMLDRLRFGINFHMERPQRDQVDLALGILGKMGFGSIRAWWDWANAEEVKGEFSWDKFDYQVELCQKYNLDIFPVILRMYGPKWTVPDRFQNPPDDLNLWDNYVSRMVTRYKGRIKYWEVWNEPDVSPVLKHKPELYLEILKRTGKIIKQIDPHAGVVGICGSYPWFFDAVLQGGGADDLDVISYHSYLYKYNTETSLAPWMQQFRDILSKHDRGRKIPVWNTEVGIINGHDGYIESEQNSLRSCSILVRNFVTAFGNQTDRLYWFSASMISLYSHSIFENNYIPAPAMVAFNAMSAQLAGAEFIGKISRPGDDSFFCYSFKTLAGKSVAVAWFNGFPTERTFKLPSGMKLGLYDIMGEVMPVINGGYLMTASSPIYIHAETKTALDYFIRKAEFIADNNSDLSMTQIGRSSPAKPTVGPFNLTSDGMLIDWNVFGPFANPGGRGYDRGLDIDYLKSLGGELLANLNLNSSVTYVWPEDMKHYLEKLPVESVIKPVEFHGASAADYYGDKLYVNLLNVLKPEKYVIGYAFCYVESPADMEALLKLGSDDGCKVFLNHEQVWVNKIYRKALRDNDTVKIKLRKGLNPLLVKISQDGGGWGFYLKLTDSNGKPLNNIKIWL